MRKKRSTDRRFRTPGMAVPQMPGKNRRKDGGQMAPPEPIKKLTPAQYLRRRRTEGLAKSPRNDIPTRELERFNHGDGVLVEAELIHQTTKAALYRMGIIEAWIPKSQIHGQTDESIVIPRWLAKKYTGLGNENRATGETTRRCGHAEKATGPRVATPAKAPIQTYKEQESQKSP